MGIQASQQRPGCKTEGCFQAHGKKTMILPYALSDIIDKFDLPGDIFDKE